MVRLILRPKNQKFDSSAGPINLKDLGLVWLQFYVLNCLNVMFKVFLNFIFQPYWRYSERGAGLARWRDRFGNTPKKVLSGGSVRPKK